MNVRPDPRNEGNPQIFIKKTSKPADAFGNVYLCDRHYKKCAPYLTPERTTICVSTKSQVPCRGLSSSNLYTQWLMAATAVYAYSTLKLFIGLATAAFMAFMLMVARAMMMAASPARANSHQLISIR